MGRLLEGVGLLLLAVLGALASAVATAAWSGIVVW